MMSYTLSLYNDTVVAKNTWCLHREDGHDGNAELN